MTVSMEDQRLIDIEIKLSHQENTIETLNEVVVKQELLIFQLNEKIDKLVKELSDERKAEKQKKARNEPPPHYWAFKPNLFLNEELSLQ